jgi:NADH-quinone oxidoreductase subunit H
MEPIPQLLDGNIMFRGIYCLLAGTDGHAATCTGNGLLPDGWAWLAYFIAGLTIILLIVNMLLIGAAVFVYAMRRILGRFHSRLGPNRVGPFGLLQPIADLIKLLTKEDLRPALADRTAFNIAPVLMVAPVLILLAVIPFGRGSYLANLNIGILFIVSITTISTIAIFLAGWGSGNRYALIGAVRAVATLISYEVPMVLALVGVALLAGSLSLVSVVEAQRLPFIVLQPLGFFVFFMAALAEINWTPFDLLEAESELTAGFHTEYSGVKFFLIQTGEFTAAIVFPAVITTIYLGGWENPFVGNEGPTILPTQIWFLLKVFAVIFLLFWIRATIPRLRVDQVMAFAWKALVPVALVNIFLTAGLVVLWPDPTLSQLWIMAGINWVVLVVGLVVISLRMERNRIRPTRTVSLVQITSEVR